MQHPVDYRINPPMELEDFIRTKVQSRASHILVFRMYEGGCKSILSESNYLEIVRDLFALLVAEDVQTIERIRMSQIERLPEIIESAPDFVSYKVVRDVGSQKLRETAANRPEPIRGWMLQEAGLLELQGN